LLVLESEDEEEDDNNTIDGFLAHADIMVNERCDRINKYINKTRN
jgi:hypothetical protein